MARSESQTTSGETKHWSSPLTTTSPKRNAYFPADSSSTLVRVSSTDSSGGKPSSHAALCKKIRKDVNEDERQEILMAFEIFDSKKAGKLNCRELKVAMRALNFQVKKEDVRQILQKYAKGRAEIDQNEFLDIMTQMYKDRDPEENLEKAFKFFDEDNTGKISLHNLRKIAKDLGEDVTDDELAAMIDEFDKDGDGEIDQAEFFGIMNRDDPDL